MQQRHLPYLSSFPERFPNLRSITYDDRNAGNEDGCSSLKLDCVSLSRLSGLERLDLWGSVALQGAAALFQLPRLTALCLGRESSVAFVKALRRASGTTSCLTALLSLEIAFARRFSDADTAFLGDLSALTALKVVRGAQLGNGTAATVARLTRLRHLTMNQCMDLYDGGAEKLASLTALEALDIGACFEVTGAFLSRMAPLTALTELKLWGGELHDETLAHLEQLTVCQVGAAAVQECCWQSLHATNNRCKLAHTLTNHCTSMPQALARLDLSEVPTLTDAGMEALAAAAPAQLTYLNLFTTPAVLGANDDLLTDEALQHVGRLTGLAHLVLDGRAFAVQDAALAGLAPLTRLTHLSAHSCDFRFEGTGFAALAAVPLRELNLSNCG